MLRCDGEAGFGCEELPVGLAGKVAAVVVVAGRPVFAVESVFIEAGDGAHALPCGGVGWGGEDLAVVEEDGLDLCHYCRL